MKIFSPTGTLFDGNVTHATFPGETGSFSVYPRHASILSALTKGRIICYASESEKQAIPVESGFVEVKDNQITACIEQTAE
jgi:F-type H+-transporting ATPase subunit epsilon